MFELKHNKTVANLQTDMLFIILTQPQAQQ